MKNYKVSIITCLYNVSRFLPAGLDCLLNQTYPNLEIIIIDDGSTDDSVEKCRKVAAHDARIKIYSKENGGLGSARNWGLDYATGDFIYFYDVDDRIELTLVERNVQLMDKHNLDLIIFGFYVYDEKFHTTDSLQFQETLIESNEKLRGIYMDKLLLVRYGNGFAWNKFYRRSFIEAHHLRFENQRIQQDEVFNLKFYPKLQRVYLSPDILYHYFIYDTGNTRSRFIPDRYEIYLSIFQHLMTFSKEWGIKDKRFKQYAYSRFYAGITNSILYNAFHPNAPYSNVERKKDILRILQKEEVRECLSYIQENQPMGIETYLYWRAFTQMSYRQIVLWKNLFNTLRLLKQKMFRK